MIFVDRGRVAPPPGWMEHSELELRKATEFFRKREARRQQRYIFTKEVWLTLKPQLIELFQGKCAYCESPISATGADIDHFRPKVEAISGISLPPQKKQKKTKQLQLAENAPDGYWWLAYYWPNIYLACQVCARNKRNRFPVLGPRAKRHSQGAALQRERALLLDPCHDRPERYLVFDDSGRVSSRVPADAQELRRFPGIEIDRGAISIEIIGLNRPDLVKARHAELNVLRNEWQVATGKGPGLASVDDKTLGRLVDGSRSYAGIRRQFLLGWIADSVSSLAAADRARFRDILSAADLYGFKLLAPRARGTATKPARARGAGKRRGATRKPAPPRRAAKRPSRRRSDGADQIDTVHIRDFRAIQDLTFKVLPGTEDRAGWVVLLGENAAGKSTALQAVALTLMGEKYVRAYMREFRLRPVDFLRRIRDHETVENASVTIQFRTGTTAEMLITNDRIRFSASPSPELFVRAYGSTRLLPRRNARRPPVKTRVTKNVVNLFDPVRPVMNANAWLARLQGTFDSAALSLKDLLNLSKDAVLEVESGKVKVPINNLSIGLDDLSAGYESVLAMAADVMAGTLGSVRDLRHATGTVLIDEIDAHLHPRWKMRIVNSLRSTFSAMQFIVTTHEPLCLRGIGEKEVVLFQRDDDTDEVTYVTDVPSPADLRVDQLLTSELFGLHSAVDPDVDAQFLAYYKLLAKTDPLNDQEQKTLAKLRGQLPTSRIVQMLGDSKREQLIYEAVDQYLAKTLVHKSPADAETLKDDLKRAEAEVKNRIAEIWTRPRETQ